MLFPELTRVPKYVAANTVLFGPISQFGSSNKRGHPGTSEQEWLAAYPSLRAEDLVNAWGYARSHVAEIKGQIRENEAA